MTERSGAVAASGRITSRAVAAGRISRIGENPDPLGDISVDGALVVLRGAYTLVMRGWCRRHLAVEDEGRSVHWPEADAPVAWSLHGAVKTGTLAGHSAALVLRKLTGCVDLQRWNDEPLRTKRQVLDLLALAIEACGGRPPRAGGWKIGGVR